MVGGKQLLNSNHCKPTTLHIKTVIQQHVGTDVWCWGILGNRLLVVRLN